MTLFTGFEEAVVFDVETTGFDPEFDRIVSLALIRTDFGSLRTNPDGTEKITFDGMFDPQCPIPEAASNVHGITDMDVLDEPPFSQVARQVREFIGDLPVIAHNVKFDRGFINAEFRRAGVKAIGRNKSFCTMRRYQEFNGGQRKGSKLDDVVRVMGVKARAGEFHDASEDTMLTCRVAELFYMMDNGIEIPGGMPSPPSRRRLYSQYRGYVR